MNWLGRLDMTVILICHQKDKWSRTGRELVMEGSTFDGYKKLDYELDLWLETKLVGTNRFGSVIKSRIEGFPVGTDIDLNFKAFEDLYGKAVVEGPVKPIALANGEQIAEIKRLAELLKVPQDEFDKWLTKAQATEVEDLSADNAVKLLDFLNKKIKGESK